MPRSEGAETGLLTVTEIKAALQERIVRIPRSTWQYFFPDMHIPIGTHITSALLPTDKAHVVDGKGKPLLIPHTIGNDVIKTYLDTEGRIMEKLVHYASDGSDDETRTQDEVLGETSDD